MKTASKPLRVPADLDESSPTPVRVLRNGKKIRATPHLSKASRVAISPEDTKTQTRATRVPFAQVLSLPQYATSNTDKTLSPSGCFIATQPSTPVYALGWSSAWHMQQLDVHVCQAPLITVLAPRKEVTLTCAAQSGKHASWTKLSKNSSLQIQDNPATPPTQPTTAVKKATSASSGNGQLSSATPQDALSNDAPSTPTAVISSMQQLQLADQQLGGITPEDVLSKDAPSTPMAVISSMQQLQLAESTSGSLLLCQELLADSSSGQALAPCQGLLTALASAGMWHASKLLGVALNGCTPRDPLSHYALSP